MLEAIIRYICIGIALEAFCFASSRLVYTEDEINEFKETLKAHPVLTIAFMMLAATVLVLTWPLHIVQDLVVFAKGLLRGRV